MTRSDRPLAVKYADIEPPRLTGDAYDTPWKDALRLHFPKFMAFFFTHAHAEIDWRKPHVFLDQELAQVVQDAELGKRQVDHLVQVATRASGLQCNGFIYMSNSRLSTMPGSPNACSPTATAARSPAWSYWPYCPMTPHTGSRPDTVINCSGARSASASRSSRILDYSSQTETLLEDANHSPVTTTHLFTRRTKDDPEQRYAAKWRLARLL